MDLRSRTFETPHFERSEGVKMNIIQNGRLVIRTLEYADKTCLYKWLNDPVVF